MSLCSAGTPGRMSREAGLASSWTPAKFPLFDSRIRGTSPKRPREPTPPMASLSTTDVYTTTPSKKRHRPFLACSLDSGLAKLLAGESPETRNKPQTDPQFTTPVQAKKRSLTPPPPPRKTRPEVYELDDTAAEVMPRCLFESTSTLSSVTDLHDRAEFVERASVRDKLRKEDDFRQISRLIALANFLVTFTVSEASEGTPVHVAMLVNYISTHSVSFKDAVETRAVIRRLAELYPIFVEEVQHEWFTVNYERSIEVVENLRHTRKRLAGYNVH
jgi:hypothetical protein